MMTTNDLYSFAINNNIQTHHIKLSNKKGFCAEVNSQKHIALSNRLTEFEERLVLAEEIGHCESDSLYYLNDINNPIWRQAVDKAERRARDWVVKNLVPVDKLIKAKKKYTTLFELADYFDVTESIIAYSIEYYKTKEVI